MGLTDAQKSVGRDLAAVLPPQTKPWYFTGHLLRLNFSVLSLLLFSSANGYDKTLLNPLQSLPQWQAFMHHPTSARLGFINAAQSLGAIVGYPVAAWFVNKYGRKRGIAVGYAFLVVATGVQAGAGGAGGFVAGRLLLGQTSCWFACAAPLLITEVAYPTQRGVATALYNAGWYVGSLLAAWITFGTRTYPGNWAWRIPSILQLLIPAFCLPGFLLCPESPRWLISVGRSDDARAMLTKFHSPGTDPHTPLVEHEMSTITAAIRAETDAKQSTTYLDMLRTPGNRHRLFISVSLGIFAQWNGVGVVSYYLALVLKTAGITDVTQQTLINGCLQVWNLLVAVSAALLVDRLGRRFLFLTSCAGMLVSYVAITGLSGSFASTGNKATGLAVIPMLFLFYGSYDIAFTPLIVAYTSEIWGFTLRARGLSITLLSTQLAVFFNIFVNPIALERIRWRYYIVYAVILVGVTLTCYFFYPETRGHSLEEMSEVFDGVAAVRRSGDDGGEEEGGKKGEEAGRRRGSGAVSEAEEAAAAGKEGVKCSEKVLVP